MSLYWCPLVCLCLRLSPHLSSPNYPHWEHFSPQIPSTFLVFPHYRTGRGQIWKLCASLGVKHIWLSIFTHPLINSAVMIMSDFPETHWPIWKLETVIATSHSFGEVYIKWFMLIKQNCKLILIACNSASAVAYELVKEYLQLSIQIVNLWLAE